MRITFNELQRRRPLRCPYCHDDVSLEDAVTCGDCRTGIHSDCRQELGRCPTSGCGGVLAVLTDDRCAWCFKAEGTRRSPQLPAVCQPCEAEFHAGLIYSCAEIRCDSDVDRAGQRCQACRDLGVIGRVLRYRRPELITVGVLVLLLLLRRLLG